MDFITPACLKVKAKKDTNKVTKFILNKAKLSYKKHATPQIMPEEQIDI